MTMRSSGELGWADDVADADEGPVLISLVRPAPGLDADRVFAAANGQPRFYWASERDDTVFVGIGVAAEIVAWGAGRFAQVRREAERLFAGTAIRDDSLPPSLGPRLFGGFAFRDDVLTEQAWASFAPAHFVLPHIQVMVIQGDPWMVLNAQLPLEDLNAETLAALQRALHERFEYLTEVDPVPTRPAHLFAINLPLSETDWGAMLGAAHEAMRAGELEKVVLARNLEVQLDSRPDLSRVLERLAVDYPDSYRFVFEARPGHAFYGASPELLVSLRAGDLRTMGLAGSAPRGRTRAEDDAFAATLLADPKERQEHALVVDAIRRRLRPLTSDLVAPDLPQVLKLSNIQHLYTPIAGRLRTRTDIVELVAQLHPTPALGGKPREAAIEFIRQNERSPRGLYAAPLGWIDADLEGAFTVAIRSAVVQDKRVWLYAGAGIMPQSQPDKEWAETRLKFAPMLHALEIEDVAAAGD